MTQSQEQARVIAEGLSLHERTIITGDPDRLDGAVADLLNLCLKAVAQCRPDDTVMLTDLGLAVRNILTGDPK